MATSTFNFQTVPCTQFKTYNPFAHKRKSKPKEKSSATKSTKPDDTVTILSNNEEWLPIDNVSNSNPSAFHPLEFGVTSVPNFTSYNDVGLLKDDPHSTGLEHAQATPGDKESAYTGKEVDSASDVIELASRDSREPTSLLDDISNNTENGVSQPLMHDDRVHQLGREVDQKHGIISQQGQLNLSLEFDEASHERQSIHGEPLDESGRNSLQPVTLGKRRRSVSSKTTVAPSTIMEASHPPSESEPRAKSFGPDKRQRISQPQAFHLLIDNTATLHRISSTNPHEDENDSSVSEDASRPVAVHIDGSVNSPRVQDQSSRDLTDQMAPKEIEESQEMDDQTLRSPERILSQSAECDLSVAFDFADPQVYSHQSGDEAAVSQSRSEAGQIFGTDDYSTPFMQSKASDHPANYGGNSPLSIATNSCRANMSRDDYPPTVCSFEVKDGDKTKSGSDEHKTSPCYEVIDFTVSPIPEGSSVMSAVIRCRDTQMLRDPLTLEGDLFGRGGRMLRTMRLPQGSWLIFGYRCDHSQSNPPPYGLSSGLRDANWSNDFNDNAPISKPNSFAKDQSDDSDSDKADSVEDDSDEETTNEYDAPFTSANTKSTVSRSRKRALWKESEKQRLLCYKDKMGMPWKKIYPKFPGRTPNAVYVYYSLLKRR